MTERRKRAPAGFGKEEPEGEGVVGWDAAGMKASIELLFGTVYNKRPPVPTKPPPVRDPQRFPVCPRCKELAALLWGPE